MPEQRAERRTPWILILIVVVLVLAAFFLAKQCPKPVPADHAAPNAAEGKD